MGYKDKESITECINMGPDDSQDSAIFLPASAIPKTSSKLTTISPKVNDEQSNLSKLPQEISGWFSGKHINYEDNQSSEQGQNTKVFSKTKQSMPYPVVKKCSVYLGKRIDEIIDVKSQDAESQIPIKNQQTISKKDGSEICDSINKDKSGQPICKGCGKHFKRIKQHLNYSIHCKGSYLMSELESGEEKKEKERNRKARQREAKRQADEKKLRAERSAEKQKGRDKKKELDEKKLRAEMSAEKQKGRDKKREMDEKKFRAERLAERRKERDKKREVDEKGFRAERSAEKQKGRDRKREEDEKEFRAERSAEKQKEREKKREVDEKGFRAERSAEMQKGRDRKR